MLLDRVNAVHWDWLVWLEMFIAGVAAGTYFVAAILEWTGRGRSPLARTAHALAFPLIILAALLLIVDLGRPERFPHMVIQSKTLHPMLKPWSPMSLGSVLLGVFGVLSFVSFVDMLIDRGRLRLDGWRPGRTMHGSLLGKIWMALGALAAFALGSYSGVLLSVTNFPGWGQSPLIGALYIATAAMTGAAALVLIQALLGRLDGDTLALDRTNTWFVIWWLVVLFAFLATLREGFPYIMHGGPAVAMVLAIIFGGIVPLVIQLIGRQRLAASTAVASALILLGGLLVRYAVVMGPQVAQ